MKKNISFFTYPPYYYRLLAFAIAKRSRMVVVGWISKKIELELNVLYCGYSSSRVGYIVYIPLGQTSPLNVAHAWCVPWTHAAVVVAFWTNRPATISIQPASNTVTGIKEISM